MSELYAGVAVDSARFEFDKTYTYLLKPELAERAKPGMRAVVPFGVGNRQTKAVILSITSEYVGSARIKPVLALLDDRPYLSRELIELAEWLRPRVFAPVAEIVRAMLPPGLIQKKDKSRAIPVDARISLVMPAEDAAELVSTRPGRRAELLEAVRLLSEGSMTMHDAAYYSGASRAMLKSLAALGAAEIVPDNTDKHNPIRELLLTPSAMSLPELSEAQTEAYEGLRGLMDGGKASCALLYGVTGSGKTHVYIKLINDALASGGAAITLVPEIGLTPQLVKRYYDAFGARIAVLHSGLTPAERAGQWKRINSGEADVVIGTRSAVFAPVPEGKLRLVVMDEEQDPAYKSMSSPRYSATDVAKWRVARENGLLVLGSATPSVESFYKAKSGVYSLFTIAERFGGAEKADVRIIDMKKELVQGRDRALSVPMLTELGKNLAGGEQSIIFLNRRGRNRRLLCLDCGHAVECPSCSNAMAYHSENGFLMCHICGRSHRPPDACPSCGSKHLIYDRSGTQKVVEEISEAFPTARVLRMDADTMSGRESHEKTLAAFGAGEADILVGTQMVAKGLDFANVTLACVADADMALYTRDYRGAERTFSLLTQVAGRSGRGEKAGRSLIQTYEPANPVILSAAAQDYDAFYESEIESRRALGLPPFYDLATVTLACPNDYLCEEAAMTMRGFIDGSFSGTDSVVLGPAPAPVFKAHNKYRFVITIRTKNTPANRQRIAEALTAFAKKKFVGVSYYTDINSCD